MALLPLTLKRSPMASPYEELIHKTYAAFNARDIDATLSAMHPGVEWPKAFEGGYVSGHDAIREYWIRQWTEINPTVQPLLVTERADGTLEVKVHQTVKGMDGNILFDGVIKHVYTLEDALLKRMDIEME